MTHLPNTLKPFILFALKRSVMVRAVNPSVVQSSCTVYSFSVGMYISGGGVLLIFRCLRVVCVRRMLQR